MHKGHLSISLLCPPVSQSVRLLFRNKPGVALCWCSMTLCSHRARTLVCQSGLSHQRYLISRWRASINGGPRAVNMSHWESGESAQWMVEQWALAGRCSSPWEAYSSAEFGDRTGRWMDGFKNASLVPHLAGEFALTFAWNPKPLTAISLKSPYAMCKTICVPQTLADNIRPAVGDRYYNSTVTEFVSCRLQLATK